MNTTTIGDIAECFIIAKYIALGYTVCKPFSHNSRYDFILEKRGQFKRVQVKSCKLKNNKLTLRAYSVNSKTCKKSLYTSAEVDAIILFCPDLNSIYEIPIEDITGHLGQIDFRLNGYTPKNNQSKGINFIDKYLV